MLCRCCAHGISDSSFVWRFDGSNLRRAQREKSCAARICGGARKLMAQGFLLGASLHQIASISTAGRCRKMPRRDVAMRCGLHSHDIVQGRAPTLGSAHAARAGFRGEFPINTSARKVSTPAESMARTLLFLQEQRLTCLRPGGRQKSTEEAGEN